MVVVGHSQGGLLTKLTVVDSGNKLWDNASVVPFEELKSSRESKEVLRRSLFFEPLPFVKRTIFLATPHRGSYIAGGWIGRIVRRFISLPFRFADTLKDVIILNTQSLASYSLKNIPRSTDNMDPKSPFMKTLASLPLAPGVIAHSIIAVKNPDDPKDKWSDGVVNYSSAHIEGVASDEEVRRILAEHLKEFRAQVR